MGIRILEALCGTKLRIHENLSSWVVSHFLTFVDYKKIFRKYHSEMRSETSRLGLTFSNVPLAYAMYMYVYDICSPEFRLCLPDNIRRGVSTLVGQRKISTDVQARGTRLKIQLS